MGRDVPIRLSYSADGVFLSRLKRAIEKDPKLPPEWKAEAISHVNALQILFMDADARIARFQQESKSASE